MTKPFELTVKELKAAKILTQSCLNGMGGKRPSDLEYDEFTWVNARDLINSGYTRHQAAGLFSSLHEKGFIQGEHNPECCETFLSTEAWKYMDSIWDSLEETV